MPQQARRWTQEEDRLLQREVQAQLKDGQVKDWRCIADQLPGRTNKDCRKRWHNAIAGGSNKGHWTQDEDRALVDAVKTHGKAWTAVAKAVPTRNAEQCAKRWKQCLDPELDRSQWTETEVGLLSHDLNLRVHTATSSLKRVGNRTSCCGKHTQSTDGAGKTSS
ncbi:Homeodomain-like protein [Aspergillus multicolor]|uniref:Homeodomain-like protein n=1 Tax=Aspergillus multicolor TaxID=41759 RepID=UPI003CCE27AE